MYVRALAIVLALCVTAALPVSPLRAETADSIMESKKTLPRHKEVKKLGVHHSTTCARRECRAGHVVWICYRTIAAGNSGCVCRSTGLPC